MSEEQHRLALPQGTRIRDFEFHRVLGHGGFGITYLGWNVTLDIPVAIKEYLPADLATREQDLSVVPQSSQAASDFQWGLERFLDEARTLARFQHPNIVRVHQYFEAHSTAYIAMDYVEGEDLSAYLTRKRTLSESELKAILYPLLSALEVVHGADFLHRDIKPGNIVLRDGDGSPVLLDFGAARQAIGAKSRSVTSIVTPGYAPIEQYSSRGRQGPWTDIYALGGVCYRALTGDVPDDPMDRIRDDSLVPVAERCAGRASGEFLSAIDVALSVDEGDRPQSVAAWRAALEADAASQQERRPEGERHETGGETVDTTDGRSSEQVEVPSATAIRKEESDASPSDTKEKAEAKSRSARLKWAAVVVGVIALLIVGVAIQKQATEQAALEKQRQEQTSLERQRQERAALEKQRREQAALEKQRQEQAALEKQRQEQAVLEKQRREQAALEKQRQEQAALEKQRQEQAALEKQRQEQAALEKQHQEQAAEKARLVAEKAEKQRREVEQGVRRGFMGVRLRDLDNTQGVVIGKVTPGRAADKAGVKADDIVLEVDGRLVRNSYELKSRIMRSVEVELLVLRKGEEKRLKVGLEVLTATELFVAAMGRMPSPDGVNDYGETDLHFAVTWNLSVLTKSLLDQGAAVNAANNSGYTPLHYAARENTAETAKLLLDRGADVNAENDKGNTPLHFAAAKNASEIAAMLLKHGAAVDTKNDGGYTPLYFTAMASASEAAAMLLKHGAAVDAKDDKGNTLLHFAAAKNASEIAAMLLKHGVAVNAKDDKGNTPLHFAAAKNASETVVVLLKHGAAVDAKRKYGGGNTPLHNAAAKNASEAAAVLLEHGATVNAKDNKGRMPLHYAAEENAPETVAVLLKHGAAVNAKYDGYTPLHRAAAKNASEAAAVLLEHGATVNEKYYGGNTPLHFAAMANASETAAVLLEHGAAVNAEDNYGNTPLHHAARKNASETVAVLRRYGGRK